MRECYCCPSCFCAVKVESWVAAVFGVLIFEMEGKSNWGDRVVCAGCDWAEGEGG